MIHDCNYCISHGLQESRVCFIPELGGSETHRLTIPDFDEDGQQLPESKTAEFDLESVFDAIIDVIGKPVRGLKPGANPFKVFNMLFPRNVCPTGLVDPSVGDLLETVSLCKHYGVLPVAGGLWDQPNKVIECMKVASEAEASFRNDQISEMRKPRSK